MKFAVRKVGEVVGSGETERAKTWLSVTLSFSTLPIRAPGEFKADVALARVATSFNVQTRVLVWGEVVPSYNRRNS